MISRLTDRSWPARKPNLSPVDYWFLSVALAELERAPPTTLEQLKMTVQDFAASLNCGEVIRAAHSPSVY